ncbi:MAG TPA: tripartite tricarboxylate transporter substrate binding protein, partial [Ramlibacter sp.]|nr:tripartite tricarboxylate transporter substrate binding protein [Ramlibacter sp.]
MKTLIAMLRPTLWILAAVSALSAHAQPYPSHPVTLVVPYPAGGSADILARSVGQKLGERLAQ